MNKIIIVHAYYKIISKKLKEQNYLLLHTSYNNTDKSVKYLVVEKNYHSSFTNWFDQSSGNGRMQ
jgi:hypothetical protein